MIRSIRILRHCGLARHRSYSKELPSVDEQKSEIKNGHVNTTCFSNFAKELEYLAILPPGYSSDENLPLLLYLHGAGQDAKSLMMLQPDLEARWKSEQIPRCVVAGFSSINGMGMYHNYHDGSLRYMDFFMLEWLPFLRNNFAVSSARSHTWLSGISMGGLGSLRLALSYPEVFAGAAALEPGLDPVFEPSELLDRNMLSRGDFQLMKGGKLCHGTNSGETKAMFGAVHHTEWNADTYQKYNPACVVRDNAQNIRENELRIYLDAADEDFFCLHDGAEFLHKTLWQYRIPHEYHLYQKADHVGPSILYRIKDMMDWLSRNMKETINPLKITLTAGQEIYMKWLLDSDSIMPDPEAQLPEGAEPFSFFDQAFVDYIKTKMPEEMKKHMDSPREGVDRLPESYIRRKRIERKPEVKLS